MYRLVVGYHQGTMMSRGFFDDFHSIEYDDCLDTLIKRKEFIRDSDLKLWFAHILDEDNKIIFVKNSEPYS